MSITIKIPLKGEMRDLICFEDGSAILEVDAAMDTGYFGERDFSEWLEAALLDGEG